MLSKKNVPMADLALKPCDVLRATERGANRIRKLLRDLASRNPASGSGTMDDAVQLATTIEQLAHSGQFQAAADAIEIVGLVELLLDQLHMKLDAILAS